MAYWDYQIILDGVCSVASELIRMDDWGIDVVMTASQKGLGTPPGLSILVASSRAIQVCLPRRTGWSIVDGSNRPLKTGLHPSLPIMPAGRSESRTSMGALELTALTQGGCRL